MAKEAVSPVERHLEKGVLALTVLLIAGVVVKYLVSSPNTMLVSQEAVGPKSIYDKVADEAKLLRERIRNSRIEVEKVAPPPEPPPILASALLSPVPFGPRVPQLKTEEIGNLELVRVLPLSKPVVVIGRSGAALLPADSVAALPIPPDEYYKKWNEIRGQDMSYVRTVNWATVGAEFDVDAQAQRALEKNYPPGRAVPYVVGAELQRRERRWDGTYGEWDKVETYAPLVLPKLPYLELEEIDGKMMIPDDQRAEIVRFSRVVRNADRQLELIRPMPPPVAYGAYWLRKPLEALLEVDLLLLDDEVWFGEMRGNCPRQDRYPHPPSERPPDPETDPEGAVKAALDEVEEWIAQGCYKAAASRLEELKRTADNYFNNAQRDRREEMLELAATETAKKEREADKREKDGLPREQPRELSPTQPLWVHDALPESVVSGKAYQYRMRALMYNNFAGATQELNNSEDAQVVLLEGEWSPPSDDIPIPYDTEFFLVGKKEKDQLGKVDVFKWHKGTWMKTSFHVTVGDAIGGKEYVKVDAAGPKEPIDFSTGATVVDLDFKCSYRARKVRRGTITLAKPKPTVAMVYLDSAGELHERLLDVDKRSDSYKNMKEEVGKRTTPGRP